MTPVDAQCGEHVSLAESDAEILACFPVMRELRPHLQEAQFVARIREQQQSGYQLAYCCAGAAVVAVAGFRRGLNLAWGHYLYVDDLVTAAACRSQGYGRIMLDWLKRYAQKQCCEQLHLDSGLQRKEAHRFYEREGMTSSGYHFALQIVK